MLRGTLSAKSLTIATSVSRRYLQHWSLVPHTVRRKEDDSCTQRIIGRRVGTVVIGILDPNQGVCGKGVLALQASGCAVELFPHELAERIRNMNDPFIRAQATLGLTITDPPDGTVLRMGTHTIKGTFINPPQRDEAIAMTYVKPDESIGAGGGWWPQELVTTSPDGERTWETTVQLGVITPVPSIMRPFWASALRNLPETSLREPSSLASMLDTPATRGRSI